MNEDKTVVRVVKNRENPYVMINKNVFTDTRLSWKSKGLMGYFLSKPDDWRILICDLVRQSKDGERAVRSGLKELEEHGYLENHPIKDERGRIMYWQKTVYECPIEPDVQNRNVESNPDRRFVHVENADVENVHVQNAGLLNTDSTNKRDIQNTDNNNKENVVVVSNEREAQVIQEVEKELGCSIETLSRLMGDWIEQHGREYVLDRAKYAKRMATSNPTGMFRKLVEEEWEISHEHEAHTNSRDSRYAAFYELFPNN